MRLALPFILALAVAFGVAGGTFTGLCACSCGAVGELCPCGNPVVPSAPSASGCSPYVPESLFAAIASSDIQTSQKSSAAPGTGKVFAPLLYLLDLLDFPQYSARQRPIALRVDLLRGPPGRRGFGKTNTRLAALSTLRI